MDTTPIWEDGTWAALPKLVGRQKTTVAVVGLGGAGLSCLLELRRHGIPAIGIDAASVGGGAAGRNGGFLLAGLADFYHDAVAILGREQAHYFYQLSLAELAETARQYPDLVRITGSLRIAVDAAEAADCAKQLAAMQADDLPVAEYHGPEGSGLLFPNDGAFQPLQRCRRLASEALTAGALLYEQTPALQISEGLITTPQGQIESKTVVVAIDGGLEYLLPELAGEVRTARLQMLATAPISAIVVPRPVYYRWGYEYWQQLPNGAVALGGFRDLAGEAEWGAAAIPAEPVQQLLEEFLSKQLQITAPITHRWAAQVSFSEHPLPLVGQVRPNLWAAGCYNGTGNLWSCICGRAIAEQIATSTSVVLEALQNYKTTEPQNHGTTM